jgi:hypothetical protein
MKSNRRESRPKSLRSGEDTDKNAKGSSKRIHLGAKSPPSKVDETASRRQADERQAEGFVAKEHPLVMVWQLLERIHSIHEKIDEAFSGQPFLPNLSPLDFANRQRFNTYFGFHRKVTKLVVREMDLYAFADCVIDQNWVYAAIEGTRLEVQKLEKRINALRLS